jgi:DNA segregation ATPase FtsK/SpoIIIE, S-DNA-T family
MPFNRPSRIRKIVQPAEAKISKQPAFIPLLDLFDTTDVNALAIDQWWQKGSLWGYLRTPIGKGLQGKNFILDLNECDLAHGPHGIIGGITGSGKSTLLRSIILSYAMTHSPNEINFALIDYMGRAAFDEFQGLPHVVGVIPKNESHENYARRVMMALEWDVQRRKQILLDAKEEFGIEANYNQYHDMKEKLNLPRLVIIFDEFAEFKDHLKDEGRSLINLAQRGRALGIHLLLCTQDPGDAVAGQLCEFLRFRICLRVASEDDSIGDVGDRDGWQVPTGRGSFRVNNNVEFQCAYPEAPYIQDERIIGIQNNGQREIVFSKKSSQKEQKQSGVIVENIKQTAKKLKIHPVPRI